jgi:hypothetical protein
VVALISVSAIAVPTGARAGELVFKNCVTGTIELEKGQACDEIPAATKTGWTSGLTPSLGLAASSDGKSLYTVSQGACGFNECRANASVARFDLGAGGSLAYEDCITGATQTGPAGSGACTAIPTATRNAYQSGLAPTSVSASPDGRSVYAISAFSQCTPDHAGPCMGTDDALDSFSRDSATGALSYQGCITGSTPTGPSGSGACTQLPHAPTGSGIGGLVSVLVTPDGKSLITTAGSDAAVAWFERDPDTGALTFRGCITGRREAGPGQGACHTFVPAMTPTNVSGPTRGVLSNDGTSLYVLAEFTILRFRRNPATGAIQYMDCITGDKTLGPSGSGLCAAIPSATDDGIYSGLGAARHLALSPDGRSLYVASEFDDAIAVFRRDPASGRLQYRGCLTGGERSGPAGSGACQEVQSQRTVLTRITRGQS